MTPTSGKKERLYIFDTTLRDGAQTQGVDFSAEDKRQIALSLDSLGVDYIEGGWPGANATDTAFFAERPPLKSARFTAFGIRARQREYGHLECDHQQHSVCEYDQYKSQRRARNI